MGYQIYILHIYSTGWLQRGEHGWGRRVGIINIIVDVVQRVLVIELGLKRDTIDTTDMTHNRRKRVVGEGSGHILLLGGFVRVNNLLGEWCV